MELDFGDYTLKWNEDIYPTPGSLSVCQALCIQYFTEAGITGFRDGGNITHADNSRAQIATKKILEDKDFLEILNQVFDVSKSEVIGPEEYAHRNKVNLSEVINAPVLEGNGIDFKKLILVRAKIVGFLSVG